MRTKSLFVIIPALIILAVGAAGAMWYQKTGGGELQGDLAAHEIDTPGETADAQDLPVPTLEDMQAANAEPSAGEDAAVSETAAPATPAAGAMSMPAPDVKASDIHVKVDGTDPKSPRSIGSVDAPVTMIEYSSLTCPHCAHAHETVLPKLIKQYVETGKLRIVFSDFPLNQQAMDASKVSRCMSADQYFGFITLLFGSIEQWAYAGKHPDTLIQNAVLAGLPEDKAKACIADKDVEQALVEGVQDAVKTYNVQSTPTFVLNNGASRIEGARAYSDFSSAIDALLPKAQ